MPSEAVADNEAAGCPPWFVIIGFPRSIERARWPCASGDMIALEAQACSAFSVMLSADGNSKEIAITEAA